MLTEKNLQTFVVVTVAVVVVVFFFNVKRLLQESKLFGSLWAIRESPKLRVWNCVRTEVCDAGTS